MTSAQFAFHLTYLFLVKIAQTKLQGSSSVKHDSRFLSVKTGESVILQCSHDINAAAKFYWYKLTLDHKLQLISTIYKYHVNGTLHNEFKNNPRFNVDTNGNQIYLKITNLQTSDSATYYCITRQTLKIEFDQGTILHVEGSGLTIQAMVQQSEPEVLQAGDSVTLNCAVQTRSCDGEHSRVYWFRNSEDYFPGLIYTHGGSKDQCGRKPREQPSTCVYNLPINNLTVSHTGTYYCAVATCGHILFGNGTKVDVKAKVESLYLLRGALVFTTSLSVLQALLLFMLYKRYCPKDPESQTQRSFLHTTAECDQNEENLHYVALRTKTLTDQKYKRSARQRNEKVDCVYSSLQL